MRVMMQEATPREQTRLNLAPLVGPAVQRQYSSGKRLFRPIALVIALVLALALVIVLLLLLL